MNFNSIYKVYFKEFVPIEERNFTVISPCGSVKSLKGLLDLNSKFFEAITDEDTIEIKEIDNFGLDLIKMIHGDFDGPNKGLNFNSNKNIIGYILQADYLLMHESLIYELCNQLFKYDHSMEPILENYHRLYQYSRYISECCLEDRLVLYIKDHDVSKEILEKLSVSACRELKIDDNFSKFDRTDYFILWERGTEIDSEIDRKLVNFRSIKEAVFLDHDNQLVQVTTDTTGGDGDWYGDMNTNVSELAELFDRSGIEYEIKDGFIIIKNGKHYFNPLIDIRYAPLEDFGYYQIIGNGRKEILKRIKNELPKEIDGVNVYKLLSKEIISDINEKRIIQRLRFKIPRLRILIKNND